MGSQGLAKIFGSHDGAVLEHFQYLYPDLFKRRYHIVNEFNMPKLTKSSVLYKPFGMEG